MKATYRLGTYRSKNISENERGVALVLVLVLSLIALAMVSALLFMVTQGTLFSGALRTYRSAEDAGIGVVESAGEMLASQGASAVLGTSLCDCNNPTDYTDNIDTSTGNPSLLCDKICNPTNQYNASGLLVETDQNPDGTLISLDVDPTVNPDNSLVLGDFTVFWKITDTIEGNTDTGGIVSSGELAGGGVVNSSAGLVNPPHTPYIYRLEVQAQRTVNTRDRARFSMLYGY